MGKQNLMRIRTKLLIWSLLAIVVPLVGVSVLAYQMAKREVINKTSGQLSQISTKQKQRIDIILQKRRENLIGFTNRYDFGVLWRDLVLKKTRKNIDAMQKYLLENIHEIDGLVSIMVVDMMGKTEADINNMSYHQGAMNEHFFLTPGQEEKISIEEVNGELELVVHYRLMIDGAINGYAVAFFKADDILTIVRDYSGLDESGETLLAKADTEGNAVLITMPRYELVGSVKQISKENINAPIIMALAKKELDFQNLLDYQNISVLGSTRYIDSVGWGLVTKIDTSEIMRPIDNLRQILIIIVVGVVVVMSTLIWIWSDFFTVPIVKLTEYTKKVSNGDLSQQIENHSNDEFGVLTRSFNMMMAKLTESYSVLENKVAERTLEIVTKNHDLEKSKTAVMNILEDVERAKTDLEKFKLAVEEASDHIVITDEEGIVLFANKAASRITGFENGEILGSKAGNVKQWGGLMSEEFYKNMWHILKINKKAFSGEVNNKRKNGEKYIANASISPILDQEGKVAFFVGIERDITHEKEIDRMKTDFISLASHQLRTPLSAMRWFSEMLLAGDAGKLTKDQTEFVTNIQEANARMIVLVNSLLNISRIESGRIVVDPEPTDLKALVEDELKEIDNQIKTKKQTVVISANPDLPKINIDPKLIREVYKNLLTNANKYTQIGGEIEIYISHKDGEIISQVSDNGLGIPLSSQSQIFERFYRAGNVVKLETEGTGLGLYLAKAIVESSGGKMWFKSEEGRGTSFWFSLPLKGMKKKTGEVSINS